MKQTLLGHDQETVEAGMRMCDVLFDRTMTPGDEHDMAVTSLYHLFFPEIIGEFKNARETFQVGTLERDIICAELGKLASDGVIDLTEVNIFHELVDGAPAFGVPNHHAVQLQLDFAELGALPLAA